MKGPPLTVLPPILKMPEPLQQYNPTRPCVKCDHPLAHSVYDEGADTMRRTCCRCGYAWSEIPLDRAKDTNEQA